jgi:adenine-specific DNA-methyltransferase
MAYPATLPDNMRARARQLRARMTDAETLLWRLLRNRRLAGAKFRRQHPMGRYILDFYCIEKRLCIELDGGQHMQAATYDAKRDAWLRKNGVHVLRFWNNQVVAETEGVMEAIYQVLVEEANSLTPCPSPVNGRGETDV